ncbi:MAG: long-chain fatty acid--CoA ligase [Deltaproteobacteria bacterium]|nr:MAG: long-chain fatty acid--CoA ligase [Deltaproteobacteria bacterium]
MGSPWMNLGQMLKINARKYPDTPCLMDEGRTFTFAQTNARVCRLANALLGMGLRKGDRISVLSENSIEFVELYLACAKAGLVINPINFRLAGHDIVYISNHAEASAFVVDENFRDTFEAIRDELAAPADRHVLVGGDADGCVHYENLIAGGSDIEPDVEVAPEDTWVLLYTSGTTGRPKGVVRSHESYVAFYLINAIDFGFRPGDRVLNIMPLCHVNTTFFTFTFTYIGGTAFIEPARGFDPLRMLELVERARINFISLIPTHYALILAIPEEKRRSFDLSSLRKLLCSSAPARVEHKKALMQWLPQVELYEGYGSTEAGIVTVLYPQEQLSKPGSIGRESLGTDEIRILDENKRPVADGEIGELYSRGPMLFDGYYKDPEKTAQSHAGEWFSAGDMAYRDADGYYYLVDRKHNMIITGGEHVFPSEVENVLCCHEAVLDAAVVGEQHEKWGEAVCAVVILKEGCSCSEQQLVEHCRERLARYKVPKRVVFIPPERMPRTSTGKILHRVLREMLNEGKL